MEKRIVFLDVDGVLTYCGYSNDKTCDIDVNKVILLKKITDQTNAEIVLISSWIGFPIDGHMRRCYGYDVLISILKENGLVLNEHELSYIKAKIIGEYNETALMTLEEICNIKTDPTTGRLGGVNKYINDYNIKYFVIIDDENPGWEVYGYDKHWIHPSYYKEDGGLQEEDVDVAINILKNLKFGE